MSGVRGRLVLLLLVGLGARVAVWCGVDLVGGFPVAGGYSVQQESMAKGAQAVEEATSLIDGHLRQLDSEVQAMFGGWSSGAQRSFANLHVNWVGQQQQLTTALREMHSALVATGVSYAAQEEQQSGAFDHISGQL